jgi:hypothetical protein
MGLAFRGSTCSSLELILASSRSGRVVDGRRGALSKLFQVADGGDQVHPPVT